MSEGRGKVLVAGEPTLATDLAQSYYGIKPLRAKEALALFRDRPEWVHRTVEVAAAQQVADADGARDPDSDRRDEPADRDCAAKMHEGGHPAVPAAATLSNCAMTRSTAHRARFAADGGGQRTAS
jgi:hypothetical protein